MVMINNDETLIKKMDEKRFYALAAYSRSPAAAFVSKEIDWYSNEDESIIGVILLDTIDYDFVGVVLGRDEGGLFRAIDVGHSFLSADSAIKWLQDAIRWFTSKGQKTFPQGDSSKSFDLFSPIVPAEKLHPYFATLISNKAFFPARQIINNMMPSFVDVDGNFIEQFQTTAFDSRLWELCLYAYLTEEELFIDRTHNAPDFLVTKYGNSVAIEAVIVGRKKNILPKYFKDYYFKKPVDEIFEEQENAMPIRFGSPLYTKLQKKYWELPHVSGNPIVLAIADFHDDQSMLWSSTALMHYLYGYKYSYHFDEKNQLVITPEKIESHKVGEKEIPSGFFFQPNCENISAVLFSASGTISKFNRIGRQAGFKVPDVLMIRYGTCYDHNPNAVVPKMFKYIVDEKSQETWGEGFSMYHNPKAKYPVPEQLFPSIAHHHFREGQLVSMLPEFHPYGSLTLNIIIKK